MTDVIKVCPSCGLPGLLVPEDAADADGQVHLCRVLGKELPAQPVLLVYVSGAVRAACEQEAASSAGCTKSTVDEALIVFS